MRVRESSDRGARDHPKTWTVTSVPSVTRGGCGGPRGRKCVGPYARLLWDEPVSVEADQQLIDQAVALLLPILETTARRAWTAPDPEEEKPAFLSEKWAWQAMYEDGGSRSWSRGELTDLARGALGVAIASQRPPLAGVS